jgi:hypothetical protein
MGKNRRISLSEQKHRTTARVGGTNHHAAFILSKDLGNASSNYTPKRRILIKSEKYFWQHLGSNQQRV